MAFKNTGCVSFSCECFCMPCIDEDKGSDARRLSRTRPYFCLFSWPLVDASRICQFLGDEKIVFCFIDLFSFPRIIGRAIASTVQTTEKDERSDGGFTFLSIYYGHHPLSLTFCCLDVADSSTSVTAHRSFKTKGK